MKKYLLTAALTFGIAASAQAWTINEYSEDLFFGGSGGGSSDVWMQIINDSNEGIIGLGVGIPWVSGIDYTPTAPLESEVGSWHGIIADGEMWGYDGYLNIAGYTSLGDYFGVTWEEAFGEYFIAYVAIPDLEATYTGCISAGTTYHSFDDGHLDIDDDFGYEMDPRGPYGSPAIAMFAQSGTSIGYTDFSNSNPGNTPVPEPATLFLFGTGLAGLIGLKRRNAAKK